MPNNSNDQVSIRGLRFPVDGPVEPVLVDPTNVLASLYSQLGCRYVEVVVLTSSLNLWCDEEGSLQEPLQPNRVWLVRRGGALCHVPLCGAVIALGNDEEGDVRSLTHTEAWTVLNDVVGATRPGLVTADHSLAIDALAAWVNEGRDWRTGAPIA